MIYSHRVDYTARSTFVLHLLINISACDKRSRCIGVIRGPRTSAVRKIRRSCDINTVRLGPDKLHSCRRRVPTVAPGEYCIRFVENSQNRGTDHRGCNVPRPWKRSVPTLPLVYANRGCPTNLAGKTSCRQLVTPVPFPAYFPAIKTRARIKSIDNCCRHVNYYGVRIINYIIASRLSIISRDQIIDIPGG